MAEQGGRRDISKGKGKAPSTATDEPKTSFEQSNATSRLVGLTEALSHVLFFLPAKDLISARQVSRGIRNTIDDSPKLQRAAFLKPEGVLDLVKYDDTANIEGAGSSTEKKLCAWVFDRNASSITPIRCTPSEALQREGLLCRAFEGFPELLKRWSGNEDLNLLVFPVALNPEISIEKPDGAKMCHACLVSGEIGYSVHYQSNMKSGFLSGYLPNSKAKYWDMLVSQPAIAACRLCVSVSCIDSEDDRMGTVQVYNSEGLKLRDIFTKLNGLGLALGYGQRATDSDDVWHIEIKFDAAAAVHTYDACTVEKDSSGLKCPGDGPATQSEMQMFGKKCAGSNLEPPPGR